MSTPKYWIRKDRETYFVTGVIITASISSIISSYWHFQDIISVQSNIKLESTLEQTDVSKRIRENPLAIEREEEDQEFYQMEERNIKKIPMPDLE